MGKLTGLFSRGATNTGDVIRQSTSLTMAYLLEQNRKFEAFMRDKVAELEGRVAAQQQTRLDYFDDDETVSPDVIEDDLDQEREQDAEETRPLMSPAADVDEPLGLSPMGFPAAGLGPVGAVPAAAPEETVPVEPVTVAKVAPTEAAKPAQEPPSWLVMLGVGEPEPAGEEEIPTALDQGAVEVEPVEEAETGWSDITTWEDMTEGDPGNGPADEETEDETDGPENTVREDTTEDDSGEDLADEELGDEETEETAEVTNEDLAEEEWEEELIDGEEMDGPEVGMLTGIDQNEAEWEEDLAGEEEIDWPEAEMLAGVDQNEVEVESDPREGLAEEMDQGPSDGMTGRNTIRMKVRKQGGVLEVGTSPAIDDEEEDTDTLLPPWLTAKL